MNLVSRSLFLRFFLPGVVLFLIGFAGGAIAVAQDIAAFPVISIRGAALPSWTWSLMSLVGFFSGSVLSGLAMSRELARNRPTDPQVHESANSSMLDIDTLRRVFNEAAVLSHLSERFFLEQWWFWTRFAGLATMNAGLFVFLTFSGAKFWHYLVGAFLGLFWWRIQWLSLAYVKGAKKRFYTYSDQYLGFDRLLNDKAALDANSDPVPANPRGSYSTVLGVRLSAAFALYWLVAVVVSLIKS